LEGEFAAQLEALGRADDNAPLPASQCHYRFHPVRQWQFDFAWPEHRLAVEIEGGTYVKGRHVTPEGYRDDCTKYNAAHLLGWRVLRFTTEMVDDWSASTLVYGVLRAISRGAGALCYDGATLRTIEEVACSR
jgi:hypothetical protein